MTKAKTLADKMVQNRDKVMAKLREMDLEDQDKVIDTLISQKGF